MATTVLNLVKEACYAARIPAPSALVGATDISTLQLTELFYETGRELRAIRDWPQLRKLFIVTLEPGRSRYQLPLDFYAAVPTEFDHANARGLYGGHTDTEWACEVYHVGSSPSRSFRVFGPMINPNDARGQFTVTPTPTDADALTLVSFEYVSRSWLLPAHWTAATAYAQNAYVNSSGHVYKKTDSGSDTTGTVAPSMAHGRGQDGGVFWTALATSAWQATTYYQAGDYRTNGGNLYLCTVGGQSAGAGGPTGTGSSAITDNTVTWYYKAAPAWAGQTEYELGDHVLSSESVYYRCTNLDATGTFKSGKNEPKWTTTIEGDASDADLDWTFQNIAYETILADTDICLFDDELMKMGLKWRFMKSGNFVYEDEEKLYRDALDVAAGRLSSQSIVSIKARNDGSLLVARYPDRGFRE